MTILRRLLALYRPYTGWLILGVLIGLATLIANVALLATAGWFVAAMGLAGAAGATINYFMPSALIRAFAIIRTGGRYGERVISHEITFRLLARLRVWLYRRIEPQSPLALAPFHSGDLAGRLRTDIDRLETVYLRVAAPILIAVIAGLGFTLWLGRYDGPFAVIEAGTLAGFGFAVPLILSAYANRRGQRQVARHTELTEAVIDGLQGMPDLLAFAAADRHAARIESLSRAVIGEQTALSRLNGLTQASGLLGSHLALWGLLIVAIPLVRAGSLAPPDLVMLGLFALASFEAVAPLPMAFLALGSVQASARRLFDLADACPPAPPHTNDAVPPRPTVTLTGVSFHYPGGRGLAPLSFSLPPGRKIAVVGPMGSGKSTLISLLTALFPPTEGTLALDGRPYAGYDPDAVRARFAVAEQSAQLFTGTVRDNLLTAKPEATEAELWECLSIAQLAATVRELPNGLDTWLGEAGLTLSGGQARRLIIARALLKDAAVLILDEPGEGLDYQTEHAVLDAVVAGLNGRSLLLITHRRAGLALMDEVITLS